MPTSDDPEVQATLRRGRQLAAAAKAWRLPELAAWRGLLALAGADVAEITELLDRAEALASKQELVATVGDRFNARMLPRGWVASERLAYALLEEVVDLNRAGAARGRRPTRGVLR